MSENQPHPDHPQPDHPTDQPPVPPPPPPPVDTPAPVATGRIHIIGPGEMVIDGRADG